MMLCQTCQRIFRDFCPYKESDHHSYVHELEQAAFEACSICRVLWRAISDRPPGHPKEISEISGIQGAVNMKPISRHRIRHQSNREKGISELSFVVDKDGVNRGGRAFTFCLQAISGEGNTLSGGMIIALTLS
jgi:hypothetical protein